MEFIIYKKSWRRGGNSHSMTDNFGHTLLYNPEYQMMDILGQMAFQAGVSLDSLAGQPLLESLPYEDQVKIAPFGLLEKTDSTVLKVYKDSDFAVEAAQINDGNIYSGDMREAELIYLAEGYGISLDFVNAVAPWFAKQEAA